MLQPSAGVTFEDDVIHTAFAFPITREHNHLGNGIGKLQPCVHDRNARLLEILRGNGFPI